jgi:hypothetical protein
VRRRWVLAFVFAGFLAFSSHGPARAQADDPNDRESAATGVTDENGVIIRASDPGATPAASQSSGTDRTAAPRCTYSAVADDFERERVLADNLLVPQNAVFYLRDCGAGRVLDWYVPGVTDPAGEALLATAIDEAMDRVAPPVPELVTSPPLGARVLTGLPMYVAVDEAAFGVHTGSVSAGPFTVSAQVEPVRIRFEPGDTQEPVTCEGRGSVWSSGERPAREDCTHTFTRTPVDAGVPGEVFAASVTVEYLASYTVDGPVLAGTYELGPLEGPAAEVAIPVVERRAVRTTGGGSTG